MRILLDECVPHRLRRGLSGHDVRTVPEMGWSGKRNGELLQLMTAQRFEVLMTVDQNLRYQQKLQAADSCPRLGVLEPVAPFEAYGSSWHIASSRHLFSPSRIAGFSLASRYVFC